MSTDETPIHILICGGGNGAHVYAGIASSRRGVEARVLTLFADEAERWTKVMANNDFVVSVDHEGKIVKEFRAKPKCVSKDPAEVAPGSHIIVMVVPAFAHQQYLEALKPYLNPGTIVVGMPGQAGFEFACRGVLGNKADMCTFVSFESLPWACRIDQFGLRANILGAKQNLVGAMHVGVPGPTMEPQALLQRTIGKHPKLNIHGHLLGMTFMGVNAYIHPSILYGRWHDWDGKPVDPPPQFYRGVDQFAVDTLTEASNEVLAIAKVITQKYPSADFSNVCHVFEWYKKVYPDKTEDLSSLLSVLRTNSTYVGMTHPCTQIEGGKYVPNFKFRYITEDIPFGLAVIRGVAEIAGVATPTIDKIILWSQKVSGKEYLVDGKMQGKDVKETRTPQRYGLTTMEKLLFLE